MGIKAAVIIERADTALGGAERSIIELTAQLADLGLDVEILAAKGRTYTRGVKILCRDIPGKRTGLSVFQRALRKELAKGHFDIIHSTMPFSFADVYQPRGGCYAESIIRNAASFRNRFIFNYKKATSFTNFRRTALLRAEKKLCKNATGPVIVALSEYVKQQFQKHYALADQRVVVIPNGVKTDKQVGATEVDKLRKEIFDKLGLEETDQPVIFMMAANNFRLKGLAVLIEAMQVVCRSNTARRAYLIIVGNGKAGKYHRMARKLGVSDRIAFLGPLGHIQNALAIADVAILPTFYDPSSRFILEALAANKPVITTRFNGAADFFINHRHGKIIDEPNNINVLADAIIYFTNTDNIQNTTRAITEDNLQEKISVTRCAKQLIELYQSLLQKKGQK